MQQSQSIRSRVCNTYAPHDRKSKSSSRAEQGFNEAGHLGLLPTDGLPQMPNTSSRKRSTLPAQTTQEEKGRARLDALTSDVAKALRRSARISERRQIEETPNQQDTSQQTPLLQKAGQGDKGGLKLRRGAVKPSTPLRAAGKSTQASPIKSKQRGSASSQLARRGNQSRRKGTGDRVSGSSRPVRSRIPSARALSAQREQTGSNKITERVNTAGRSSRGKRGRGRGGRQRTSSEGKAPKGAEATGYQLGEEAQGKALPQPSASRKRSLRRQTEAAEASRPASPEIEQTQQENPGKEAQVGDRCSLDWKSLRD